MTNPQSLPDFRVKDGNDGDGQNVLDDERERGVDRSAMSDGPLFVAVKLFIQQKLGCRSLLIKFTYIIHNGKTHCLLFFSLSLSI